MYVCVHVCLCVLVTGTPRGHARDSGGSVLAVTGQSPATRRDACQDGARAPPTPLGSAAERPARSARAGEDCVGPTRAGDYGRPPGSWSRDRRHPGKPSFLPVPLGFALMLGY